MKPRSKLIAAYVVVMAAMVVAAAWGLRGYEHRKFVRMLPAVPDLQRWPVEFSQRVVAATQDAGKPSHAIPALTDLALLYFANGYGKESTQVLALLAEREPQNARWPYLEAILNERSGQRDEAIKAFGSASHLAPDYAPAKRHLGDLLLAAGQTTAAHDILEKIRPGAAEKSRPMKTLSQAGPASETEAAGIAIQPLIGSQASVPDDDPYVDEAYAYSYDTYRLQSFGEMRLLAQRYQSAIFFLHRAVEVDPSDAAPAESLAVAYTALHQLQDARQVLETALRSNPTNDGLQARLAEVLISQDQPREALALLERAVAKSASPSARLANARGEAFAALQLWAEAAAAFEEAAKINPVAPEYQLNITSCYLHLGKADVAAGWADRALKLHPGDLRGLALSTAASLERGRFDEGLETAHQLVTRDPENSDFRTLYASAALQAGNHWAEAGDDARAERAYREGLAIDDQNGDLHGALGVLLSINHNFSDARSELDTFLRLEPRNPLAYLLLGSSLNDSGQSVAARQIWERGLDVALAAKDENRASQLRALLAR